MTDHTPANRLTLVTATRPRWMRDALCREYPRLDFVKADDTTTTKANCLQICGRCLVRPECLAWALADPTLLGVLGGTDTAARKAIRANRTTPTSKETTCPDTTATPAQ